MTRTRLIAAAGAATLVAAVLAALALGARAPEPVRAVGGEIEIVMDDFRFEPQRIRARPGPLRLRVRNAGTLPHALRVVRAGTEGEAGRVLTRKPGESAVLEIEKVNRGRYRYLCPLSHHEDLGMHGELIVR